MEAQKKLRLALIGALVVILVLVGALVWSLTSDSGEVKAGPVSPSTVATATGGGRVDLSEPRPGNTVPATSQASINPTGKVDTWGSVCGLAGVELKPTRQVNMPVMRTKVFADSTYYYYNNLTGPGKRADGDVPTCYAHSSEGAILAAANIRVMVWAGKKSVELAKTLFYENDAQQLMLKRAQKHGDYGTISGKIVGYSIEVIDENNVVVNLAFTRSDEPGELYKSTFKMTWSKGDWKLVIPADGKLLPEEISSITDAGMVSWIL
jgi:hypothetical protein